jgi:tetratricopeptide (TPR) repeat protein
MRWQFAAHNNEKTTSQKDSHSLVHRVAEGELLNEIALNYYNDNLFIEKIKTDNNLKSEPKSGDELTLYFNASQWPLIAKRMKAIDAYNSGVAALNQGRTTDARLLFNTALDIDSDFQNARYNLALVEMQLGELVGALGLLDLVQAVWPKDLQVTTARGNILFMQEKYPEAKIVFESIHKSDPKNSTALFSLARCMTELGEKNEARKTWKQFLELDNSSSWAKIARRYLKELEGK